MNNQELTKSMVAGPVFDDIMMSGIMWIDETTKLPVKISVKMNMQVVDSPEQPLKEMNLEMSGTYQEYNRVEGHYASRGSETGERTRTAGCGWKFCQRIRKNENLYEEGVQRGFPSFWTYIKYVYIVNNYTTYYYIIFPLFISIVYPKSNLVDGL